MLKILLIRHSMTAGNKLGRYIGARTDEPLCEEGIRLLENFSYPPVQRVFVSPMRRCRETAEILFPGAKKETEEHLKECDFGIFENKNYQELSGEPRYQAWIDSNGTLPFPEGESQKMFQKRCVEGFARCVEQCLKEKLHTAAFVVHGGTIMSILSACADPGRSYFEWQVKNAQGYEVWAEETKWRDSQKIEVTGKYTQEGFDKIW